MTIEINFLCWRTLVLRVSSGFQTFEGNKTTRPAASWFQMFSRVWKPYETLAFVFEIVLHVYCLYCSTFLDESHENYI